MKKNVSSNFVRLTELADGGDWIMKSFERDVHKTKRKVIGEHQDLNSYKIISQGE